jgi:YidC/Oxa1 family membrane protein insertase
MSYSFNTFLVTPLYNGFIYLLNHLPFLDAGIVIIIFTVIVSFLLYPLSKKALATQARTKQFEGEIAQLKERYKNNKEEHARQLMAFYKEKGINPLSGIAILLIQIPIILALYQVFIATKFPIIDVVRLYSFVPVPETINMYFLGLIDISGKSLILALLAAVAQFVQGWFSPAMQAVTPKTKSKEPSFEESFAASMRIQTRYVLPIIIFLISYQYSGVIALYLFTRSAFMFGQEMWMKRSNEMRTTTV